MEGLAGNQVKQFFEGGLRSLAEQQQEIDRLNVFPVPDGDTGRNMYLTLSAAIKELQNISSVTVNNVCEALAKGSLMGARGNSGVIFSQLIRGLSEAMTDREKITVKDFAKAWQAAVTTAYHAVIKPVEGTMLTVSKAFSQGLNEGSLQSSDWVTVLKFALKRANEALDHTPDLLPELKRAGVVDAGGKGLVVVLEGGLRSVMGAPAPVKEQEEGKYPADLVAESEITEEEADFTYLYCVSLLLQCDIAQLDQIRSELQKMGGSMVIGGAGDLIKLHIHSNHPGEILEHILRYGTIHNIEVCNMKDQWQESHPGSSLPPAAEQIEKAAATKDGIGVVAVASGEGLTKLFTELGAERIIEGGQTMNPPVEEFVKAINELPSERVIILPNNKNLLMAAEQAKQLVNRQVAIIPSKSIPAGIAALLAFNQEGSLTENKEQMTARLNQIKAGEVTYAVRDAELDGHKVKKGDLIGLAGGKLLSSGSELEKVLTELIDQMVTPDDELITLFSGAEVEPGEADRIAGAVGRQYDKLEVEAHRGGQPVYYYLLSVE